MASFNNEGPGSSEFKEKLVSVNRVSKTVKGGRIFKFSALFITLVNNPFIYKDINKEIFLKTFIKLLKIYI